MSRYRGTVTAAPHFAYQLTARRIEAAEATKGALDLDLSSMVFLGEKNDLAKCLRTRIPWLTIDTLASSFGETMSNRTVCSECVLN